MDGLAARILVSVAVVGIAAIDALYLAIIEMQDGVTQVDVLTVPFVAIFLGLMAALLGASLATPVVLKPVLRAAASAGLFILGLLAIFSIGVPILILAGLAFASWVIAIGARPEPRVLGSAALTAVVAGVVLIGGLELTSRYLVCPRSGQGSGTTGALFGSVSYECNNGRLTVR